MQKPFIKHINKYVNDVNYQQSVLVTGGNSGIGLELIKVLTFFHYQIIFTVRNKDIGESTIKILQDIDKNVKAKYYLLDLSKKESIKNFVDQLNNDKVDINHVYHNAGIFRIPHQYNEEGIELTMATNYIGTYYLNELLIKNFATYNHDVHINFITSLTSYYYRLDQSNLFPKKDVGKMRIYARSKTCLTQLYYYYISDIKNPKIRYTISHPGATYTPIIIKGYKNIIIRPLARIFMKIAFHSPKKATLTYLYSLNNNVPNGYYITPRGLLELSGYPKIKKLKKKLLKNYKDTIKQSMFYMQ